MFARRIAAAMLPGLFAALAMVSSASAQNKITIGIVGQFSGPFALSGMGFRQGIEAFQSVYGTKVGGREVELIYRDIGGANPSVSKQLTQELIVRDKASLIGGYYLSPDSMAAAPVLTETKTPGVVFNGAADQIPGLSPYIVRMSATHQPIAMVQATWARSIGKKRAYIVASDFLPGQEIAKHVAERFKALGGEVLGTDLMPLNTVDYAPFAERIANAKPDYVSIFIPPGPPAQSFIRALQAAGMLGKKDVSLIGTNIASDSDLHLFDDSVIGLYDGLAYAVPAPGEENKKYKAALAKKFPDAIPNYDSSQAWIGMKVLYKMVESQQGKPFDGTTAVEAVTGWTFEGPSGKIKIEQDRNASMSYFIRKVVKGKDGKKHNEIVDVYPLVQFGVKDMPLHKPAK